MSSPNNYPSRPELRNSGAPFELSTANPELIIPAGTEARTKIFTTEGGITFDAPVLAVMEVPGEDYATKRPSVHTLSILDLTGIPRDSNGCRYVTVLMPDGSTQRKMLNAEMLVLDGRVIDRFGVNDSHTRGILGVHADRPVLFGAKNLKAVERFGYLLSDGPQQGFNLHVSPAADGVGFDLIITKGLSSRGAKIHTNLPKPELAAEAVAESRVAADLPTLRLNRAQGLGALATETKDQDKQTRVLPALAEPAVSGGDMQYPVEPEFAQGPSVMRVQGAEAIPQDEGFATVSPTEIAALFDKGMSSAIEAVPDLANRGANLHDLIGQFVAHDADGVALGKLGSWAAQGVDPVQALHELLSQTGRRSLNDIDAIARFIDNNRDVLGEPGMRNVLNAYGIDWVIPADSHRFLGIHDIIAVDRSTGQAVEVNTRRPITILY